LQHSQLRRARWRVGFPQPLIRFVAFTTKSVGASFVRVRASTARNTVRLGTSYDAADDGFPISDADNVLTRSSRKSVADKPSPLAEATFGVGGDGGRLDHGERTSIPADATPDRSRDGRIEKR
jgi:hypothetical protein